MTQYCRYCSHSIDYNGEATDFICSANAVCGNHGAGQFYDAAKAKRANKCKHFDFNPNDIFRMNPDGTFAVYKPRGTGSRSEKQEPEEQMALEDQ